MATSTWVNLPEEKRTRILDAARAEFARVGYQAGSVNVIAAEADIAKGSLFQYFADKRDLFDTVVSDNSRRVAAATIDQIDGRLSFFDLVDDLVRRWVAHFVNDQESYQLAKAAGNSGDREVTDASRLATVARFRAALCPVIDAGIAQGDLAEGIDPDLVLSLLVALLRQVRSAHLEPNYDPGLRWDSPEASERSIDAYVASFRRSVGLSCPGEERTQTAG